MAQGDAITVCISRTVKPGCEADFERALHDFVQRSLSLPGAPLRAFPKWKMAIATFLGVFPVAMLLSLTLGRVTASWNFILANLVFNACVVALLTWIVMPVITRALHGWLYAEERKTSL